MKILLIYSVLFHFIYGGVSHKIQSLSGQWIVRNKNNDVNIPATVPGGIYSDLQSANIIDDIYFRFNDIKYRWVANDTWIYNYIFNADKHHFNKECIDLVFDGLDTFSTIIFNDVVIGQSDNMFIRYEFNIKQYLTETNNNITIIFQSPVLKANKLNENYAKTYVIPPACVPDVYKGECHVNLIRKMQASFSWDWGPAFPSVGIWKPLYIRSYNQAVIQDLIVNIYENPVEEFWHLNCSVYFKSNTINRNINGIVTTKLKTDLNEIHVFTTINGTINENGDYMEQVVLTIPKAHVKLWWPNGFGKQYLYNLTVIFHPEETEQKSTKHIKVAFRKIELIQNEIENGLTFYFKVNNLPIFAKGSNWIPGNILPERGYDVDNLKYLLNSAKDVHMNMMRVWGGGVYESDEFYNLADELGILIWQDFMFACSMYPVDTEYLKSVKIEVEQQVRRLQHHASIAIWAGNNENEVALRGNWYGTSSNFTQYKKDYIILYVDVIKQICEKNDPTRSYLVSSPSNGLQSEKEGYIAKDPYDTHYGDIHYYNYISDGWNQNTYKRTRFSSEYGFQSVPSYATLLSSTNDTEDLKLESDFLESRQHHLAGYNEMKFLINRHLTWPNQTKDTYFKTFIYYSQISQAMAYKAQTEYYRQWRSKTDETGSGLTMGALYWQLNDVWPAPSWASIDFKHRWKMVHYFARNFFAPVLISGHLSSANHLSIYTLSDETEIITNTTLTMSIYNWDKMKPIHEENMTLNILPSYSGVIKQFWLDKYLEDIGCGKLQDVKKNCFVYFTLKNINGKTISPDNYIFPAPLKTVNGLTTPNLTAKVENTNSNVKQTNFNVTITTDNIALFVWLETGAIKGTFSDNGFLQVTKQKTINFKCDEAITAAQLQTKISITSLKSKEHL